MRKKFIAGNWKMYTTAASARDLAAAVARGLGGETRVSVAVCPPFPYLIPVAETLRGSNVALGAQNVYPEKEGAFTGEVSPQMLLDVGCRYVIVGHSERRHILHETDLLINAMFGLSSVSQAARQFLDEIDLLINRKVQAALAAGLHVIFCVGETLEEREGHRTEAVLETQLSRGLAGLSADRLANLVIAYEPVWAIGTGRNATPQQAQDAHAYIRQRIARLFGENAASALPIQYGGSVKPENAAALLAQPDVDGALVGGASLKADSFLAIVKAGVA